MSMVLNLIAMAATKCQVMYSLFLPFLIFYYKKQDYFYLFSVQNSLKYQNGNLLNCRIKF